MDAALAAYMQDSGSGMGLGRGMGMMGRGGRGFTQGLTLADATGRVVYDSSEELTGKRLSDAALAQGIPLTVGELRVGTLLNVLPADTMLDTQGQAFLDRVRQSLLLAGLAAVVLALLLGFLISWRLTAPVRQLTHAAGVIAGGDLANASRPGAATRSASWPAPSTRWRPSWRPARRCAATCWRMSARELRAAHLAAGQPAGHPGRRLPA